MTQPCAPGAELAKSGTARSFGENRKGLRLNASVMQISRGLFPLKTALHLADLTGYSVRSCEYWLSEKSVIPADALASLMQSDQGRDFLVAVMADSTPRWWLKFKAWAKAIDFRTADIKHRRMLRDLLNDAGADAADPISSAMLIQDEDFYSGLASPPRIAHRAVASKGGR